MKKIMYYLPSILFNLLEVITLSLIGYFFIGIDLSMIIISMVVFTLCRQVTQCSKHYKSPILCSIWSIIVFSTLFCVIKVDELVGMLLTIVASFTQTGLLDANELFMWRRGFSKYADMAAYIKLYNNTKALKEFEQRLQNTDELAYAIYVYKFKEGLSFESISERLNHIDNRRIVDVLNCIQLSFNIYFNKVSSL